MHVALYSWGTAQFFIHGFRTRHGEQWAELLGLSSEPDGVDESDAAQNIELPAMFGKQDSTFASPMHPPEAAGGADATAAAAAADGGETPGIFGRLFRAASEAAPQSNKGQDETSPQQTDAGLV